LLGGRLAGLGRTLVFPMADTAVAFAAGFGVFGTMGHLAGTQVENLPARPHFPTGTTGTGSLAHGER
jgi:hypothetical protein